MGQLMMIDYNVSDHWPEDEPVWVRSLVSSLDRFHGRSTVLPLTVATQEISDWVELASGVDAWKPRPNRTSLELDLGQSVDAIGPNLAGVVAGPLQAFRSSFATLIGSTGSVLSQPPGTRTAPVWVDVATSATDVLEALTTDAAVGACWDDLVAIAQDPARANREYRGVSELLFDQLVRRGLDAEAVFRAAVEMLA